MMQQSVGKTYSTNNLPRSQLNGFVKRNRMMALSMGNGKTSNTSLSGSTAPVLPDIPVSSSSRPPSGKQPGMEKATELKVVRMQEELPLETQAVTEASKEVVTTVEAAENASLKTISDQADSGSGITEEEEKKPAKPKKTEEEWELETKRWLEKNSERIQKTSSIQQKDADTGMFTSEFLEHLKKVQDTYFKFKNFPYKFEQAGSIGTAKILLSAGIVPMLCGIVEEILQSGEIASEVKAVAKNRFLALRRALATLMNYSDCCNDVACAVGTHGRMLDLILKQMAAWFHRHKDTELSANEEILLRQSLGLIHNTAMMEDNVEILHEVNAVSTLSLYLESPKEAHKLSAFATLADIVSEEEADKLATSPKLVKFLLSRLSKALNAKDHRCFGWNVTELVRAVRRLARNSANNRLLVEHGVLPLLNKGVRSSFDDEKCGCMEALWVLSFEEKNREDILNSEDLLDYVTATSKDSSQPSHFRQSCHGFLFQLREGLTKVEKYKDVGEKYKKTKKTSVKPATAEAQGAVTAATEGANTTVTQHIMLSYQWANQPIVKQIRDILRAQGYKVWMDVDDMGGSTLQAMAEAVEDAYVVVICMSQKYKDSPNTRAEAEYAFQKRKAIIPLIMQLGYRPDGWLGMILGAKLFYDFSGKYPFESRIDQLLKAVKEKNDALLGKKDMADGAVVPKAQAAPVVAPVYAAPAPAPARPAPPGVAAKVKDWGPEDVKKWLKEFGLDGTELERLTGKEIFFLYNLRSEAPEFFYNTLEKRLQIRTLSGFMSFTDALSALPSA